MSAKPKALLPAGTPAPDFSLQDVPDGYVSLSDYAGSPIVLLFYTADFNPVCTDQLTVFNEALPEFHRRGAQVIGISGDSVWCHVAFGLQYNMHFPLLADYFPVREVGRTYRVPVAEGEQVRTVYVVGADGRIVWADMAPPDIALDVKGALETVENL